MISETIAEVFTEVFRSEMPETQIPDLTRDLVLLDSGLDSLGLAMVVVELEDRLGYDPFSLSDEAFYPETYGQLVDFYERFKP